MREKLQPARPRLVGREPAERRRVLDRLALARAPLEQDGDEGEMRLHAAGVVAADPVEHGEDRDGLGGDAGLLLELAPSAFMDGLAQLDEAAGKAPLSDAWRHRALRQEDAAAPPHHGETTQDGTVGIDAEASPGP